VCVYCTGCVTLYTDIVGVCIVLVVLTLYTDIVGVCIVLVVLTLYTDIVGVCVYCTGCVDVIY
jgi:hypothetical protein